MQKPTETDLYRPVKAWLEARGYEVKSEVGPVDVMGVNRAGEVVIVELKLGFSLALLHQAVARQAVTDEVYVAVPRWKGKAGWRSFKGNIGLCKRLGIGVLSLDLDKGGVQTHATPSEFCPRKSPRRRAALAREFAGRDGDPNDGGTRGPVMTAYKQEALRCVDYLAARGPCTGAQVARDTGVARATLIMRDNHSGWFFRVARGTYALSSSGLAIADTR